MTIIDCPECGDQVSTEANACPHCGAPVDVTRNERAPVQSGEKPDSDFIHRLKKVVRTASYGQLLAAFFTGWLVLGILAQPVETGQGPFDLLVGFGVLVWSLITYMIPSILAWKREHHQTSAITILNLTLGWTVLGWIGALVWSFTAVESSSS